MSDDELMEMERRFWLEGGDFFAENADEATIWILPKDHGIVDHATARDLIDREGRWDAVEFGEVRRNDLGDGVTVIAYEATGTKDGADGEVVYRAQCTTIYRGETLVHHHQTAIA